jgi:hypothetical protein
VPITDNFGQGFTGLDYGDVPDLKTLSENLLTLTGQSVMRFASASARNATLTSPAAGMAAWLSTEKLLTVYDGTTWVVVAAGSQTWTTPSLASGYTNNGNSNGTVRWRKINLFGDPAIMWSGGINVTYPNPPDPANNGMFLSTALPTDARPTSRRTVTAACSGVNSDQLSMKVDFNTDGTVQIIAKGGALPPWISLNNVMYTLT